MPLKRRIERIMLIVPPLVMPDVDAKKRIAPPLGIACLAAVLEKDYDVRVLDTVMEGYEQESSYAPSVKRVGLTDDEITRRLADFNPDLIGLSVAGTDQYPTAHATLRLAREVRPDAITVMGGIYPTTQPEKALGDANLDYVVLGEGDLAFSALVRAIESGDDAELPDGIGRRENGRPALAPKKNFIENLDALPPPARHKLRMDLYVHADRSYRFGPLRRPHTSIFTSRGCPGRCIFCDAAHMMGRRFRAHSAARVLDEIQGLITDYGIRELAFLDDNLTWDRARAEAIFDGMVKRGFDLAWMTPNGLALYAISEPLIEKMKQSGCYAVYLAFESGCQEVVSKVIRKPLNLKKARRYTKKFKELGIETTGMFVIGFPGETKEQIEQTIRFAEDVECDYVSFSIATPYPGTELYRICERDGYFVDGFNDDDLVFGFGRGHIRTPDFTPDDVLRFRREAWERINFRTDPVRKQKVEEWLKR
ncbi:MAG: radical SAM protein [bacterium]